MKLLCFGLGELSIRRNRECPSGESCTTLRAISSRKHQFSDQGRATYLRKFNLRLLL